MNKAVVIPAVLAAGIACAAVAQADNDQYDQYMISHGMTGGANCAPANPNCGQSLEYLLQEGQKACAAFAQGVTDMSVIGQFEGSPGPLNPGTSVSLGRSGAENIVYAAHHYLCP
jgi:hypothetical protein